LRDRVFVVAESPTLAIPHRNASSDLRFPLDLSRHSMSSAATASASSLGASPQYYFFQSPYLAKEMEAALHQRSRVAHLASRGLTPLHRLRRGDLECSYLSDERQRPAIGPQTDRILNKSGTVSPALNEKAVAPSANGVPTLTTPTEPLFLYWTDGAKRTLPFLLLKNVSLRRGAARHGVAFSPSWSTPDRLLRILGGSSALNCRLLDDKCLMKELLHGKRYVPATESFDITQEGWQDMLKSAFSQNHDPPSSPPEHHLCAEGCKKQYLILKPSLGHKQRGILILPHCLLHLPTALTHVSSQVRPGGSKGVFETWVVQAYVKEPLCLSGLDLALLWEEGEEMKEKEGTKWRNLLTTTAEAVKGTATPATVAKLKQANEEKQPQQAKDGSPSSSPKASPTAKRRTLTKTARVTAAASSTAATSASTGSSSASRIRHTLTPTTPFLPSDSSLPVHMLSLHKLHFRVFAMVRYSERTGRYEIYWSNLSKVYHATRNLASIQVQQPPAAATAASSGGEEESKQPSSSKSDFDTAASYFFAQSSSSSTPSNGQLFPPLSTLPPSVVTLSPSYDSPSLSFDISVSKYLAMRLAHHIFPEERLRGMFGGMKDIIVDTVREAIEKGGMKPCGGFEHAPGSDASKSHATPPGLSETYFQFLGYDFLYDTVSSQPVLLEINNNVGQGLMSQETMSTQLEESTSVIYGHSNAQYTRMRDYWREHFRQPFIESAMRINVDRYHDAEPLPLGSSEPVRLMSSPPREDENCWVLADVYERRKQSNP
jgi:hypothetical protein